MHLLLYFKFVVTVCSVTGGFLISVPFVILTVLLRFCAGEALAEEAVHGVAEIVQKRLRGNISPSGLWHSVRFFC